MRGALPKVLSFDKSSCLFDYVGLIEKTWFGHFNLLVNLFDSFLGALLDKVSNIHFSGLVPMIDS